MYLMLQGMQRRPGSNGGAEFESQSEYIPTGLPIPLPAGEKLVNVPGYDNLSVMLDYDVRRGHRILFFVYREQSYMLGEGTPGLGSDSVETIPLTDEARGMRWNDETKFHPRSNSNLPYNADHGLWVSGPGIWGVTEAGDTRIQEAPSLALIMALNGNPPN